MKIIKNVAECLAMNEELASSKENSLGFVPTMGNLHDGHFSLAKRSLAENSHTVCSIFVNPMQFNQAADFENYPKTLEADLDGLKALGVDYCLLPDERMIYPSGYRFQLSEHKLSLIMEGKHRSGHFEGVLTVVLKLVNLVRANNCYFGEKDYQQYALVKAMCEDLFIPTKIIGCATVREPGGLALSSRNSRLNEAQLARARTFARVFHQGEDVLSIKTALEQEAIDIDYIEDFEDRRYGAVFIDDIRLIDNYSLSS